MATDTTSLDEATTTDSQPKTIDTPTAKVVGDVGQVLSTLGIIWGPYKMYQTKRVPIHIGRLIGRCYFNAASEIEETPTGHFLFYYPPPNLAGLILGLDDRITTGLLCLGGFSYFFRFETNPSTNKFNG